jgi:hypothetical protein
MPKRSSAASSVDGGGGGGAKKAKAPVHPCAFLGDVFLTAGGEEVGIETATSGKLCVVVYTASW